VQHLSPTTAPLQLAPLQKITSPTVQLVGSSSTGVIRIVPFAGLVVSPVKIAAMPDVLVAVIVVPEVEDAAMHTFVAELALIACAAFVPTALKHVLPPPPALHVAL
jgi:hypothetical protein